MADAIGASLRVLIGRWTLLALLAGIGIAAGVHRAEGDLAGAVFTASATFAALVVPAAALANTLLENRLLSYVDQLVQLPDADRAKAATAADSLSALAARVVGSVEPAVHGLVFLLLSFGLSIGALFHPNHHIWTGAGWWKVNLEDLLIGGALGLDVVAMLLFLPFVLVLLDRSLAKDTLALIQSEATRLGTLQSAEEKKAAVAVKAAAKRGA
jgi:hypothetical protein